MDIRKRAEELGLETSEDPIQPGDLYLAERKQGPKLLTCLEVHKGNWIVPVENAYCYDTWECIKVIR